MTFLTIPQIASICGIMGNIVSFMVFLAPVPTFYQIYKEKSTKGFHSTPYAVALFSAVLLLYYGFLKPNGIMLITINSIGSVVEISYIIIYLIYATKEAKVQAIMMVVLFNIIGMGLLVIVTLLAFKGEKRIAVVGWFTATFCVCVFAAPLSILRLVIKTKSVEFMPFTLSFFLMLNAITWFAYGFLIKDYYIAAPNVLGVAFGITQMILYAMYRKGKNKEIKQVNGDGVIDMSTIVVLDSSNNGAVENVNEENSRIKAVNQGGSQV